MFWTDDATLISFWNLENPTPVYFSLHPTSLQIPTDPYRSSKQSASKQFYKEFVTNMKKTKPSQYFKMAKRIGAVENNIQKDLKI